VNHPQRRIRIQWTESAKEMLRTLPKKVREGLLNKADLLYDCGDPRLVHKPLQGPLEGHYTMVYSRYRAVFRVEEDELANGDSLITLTVLFIAVGKRAEYSRDDVYKVAQKVVEMGLISMDDDEAQSA